MPSEIQSVRLNVFPEDGLLETTRLHSSGFVGQCLWGLSLHKFSCSACHIHLEHVGAVAYSDVTKLNDFCVQNSGDPLCIWHSVQALWDTRGLMRCYATPPLLSLPWPLLWSLPLEPLSGGSLGSLLHQGKFSISILCPDMIWKLLVNTHVTP